jgi:hypothetical protein
MTIEIARLDAPDEVREFTLGRFELYRIGGGEIGRAIYEPGWRSTEHVRPIAGTELVRSPRRTRPQRLAGVKMVDGSEHILRPGASSPSRRDTTAE